MNYTVKNSNDLKLVVPSYNGLYQDFPMAYEFDTDTEIVKFFVKNSLNKVLVNNGEPVTAEAKLVGAKMVPKNFENPPQLSDLGHEAQELAEAILPDENSYVAGSMACDLPKT